MRLVCLALLLTACPAPVTDSDTGPDTDADSGTEVDTDIGTDSDTEPFTPADGFGVISGDCGPLDSTEFVSAAPFSCQSAIDLPAGFDDDVLSEGGLEMVDAGNLNQGSLYSEVFSYEVLYRCEGAELLLTEGEVIYDDPAGKKTDLVIDVDGYRLGMSVVRAVTWPRDTVLTVERAEELLDDKLADILISSANVSEGDAWDKQILHVIAYSPNHANAVVTAHGNLSDEVRADTILWVTATNGTDGFIYGDDD
jgi:hypothetical protein